MPHTRRNVLTGIGTTVAAVGGAGVVIADPPGDRGRDDDEEDERGDDEAAIRVAHASPDAPNVDVYVDGSRVIADLAFRSVTDYLEVPAGEYDVQVTAAGDPDAVVFDATAELDGEDYTAVALGEVTSDDTEFTVRLFEDDNGRVFGETARVRAVHASPDAPAVDVTVNDGSATLFDGLAFGESGGYVEVPAGEYTVEVRPDTDDDDGPVVFETTLPVETGNIYTVFAVGYLTPDDDPTDEGFGLVPVLDKTAPPRGGRGDDDDDDDDDEEDDEYDDGDEYDDEEEEDEYDEEEEEEEEDDEDDEDEYEDDD
jgi:hypothetical protein